MAETSIEWATHVWNPSTGCDQVSPGCDNCYALKMAKRLKGMGSAKYQRDGDPRTSGPGFGLSVHADTLTLPLEWKSPRRVFVNSMSDLFHDEVPDEFIASVFAVMSRCPQHTFQILTKRHGRMRALLNSGLFWVMVNAHRLRAGVAVLRGGGPVLLPNVWLGVSVESQKWADIRIPALLDTSAAVRWLSCEPLLGPVDLGTAALRPYERQQGGFWEYGHGEDAYGNGKKWVSAPPAQIDWVVAGGESGPGARPAHPDWFRRLRDQCVAAGIPYFLKQWGEWVPEAQNPGALSRRTAEHALYVAFDGASRPARVGARSDSVTVQRVGKKVAGRELDGRTWDEYPRAVPA